MESNGAANCIHLSRNTADLIELTGKGQWLTPREDEINCKGKGTMQTYWFEVKNSKRMRRMSLGTAFQEFASTTKSTLDISTHSEAMVRPDYSSTRQRDLLRHQHSLIWGSAGEYGSVDSLASLNLSRYCIDSTARLIDWNANVLSRLLKQVVS